MAALLQRALAGVRAPAAPAARSAAAPRAARPARSLARPARRAARADAAPSSSTTPSTTAASLQEYVEAEGLRIERVSFGAILTTVGCSLLIYGFGAFFQLIPGGGISSILLIYGFPVALLGFALSYAQLEPVRCRSTAEALAARDAQATDIQKQVREDTTRFRYGDEQHLEEALNRVFKLGRRGGVPRRACPRLAGVREELRGGKYTLVLEFENAKAEALPQAAWDERVDVFATFFGPGVVAEMAATPAGQDVALIADGSGAGRGGGERPEVLPPLMPGLPGRQAKQAE